MSRPVFVRPARRGEGDKFLEWSKKVEGFDFEIALHANTSVLVAYNKAKVIGFLPVQQPFVLETFASNPDATELEIAQALAELVKFVVSQGHIKNVPEIYFLDSHGETSAFAASHIFEELPYKVYRVKITDLEPIEEVIKKYGI